MIWTDGKNQVWRDDNTREVWIVTPKENFVMRVVRYAQAAPNQRFEAASTINFLTHDDRRESCQKWL